MAVLDEATIAPAPGDAEPAGIIEMTSAVSVTASTPGTGTASASASPPRPVASAVNAAPQSATKTSAATA